jgi:hypothetical protein
LPRLLRIVDVGGKAFCAFIESNDLGYHVTFTIDSEPYKRRRLNNFSPKTRDEEAVSYFKEWLAEFGVSMASSELSLADELVKLAALRSNGMLSENEFIEAKRKLLKD